MTLLYVVEDDHDYRCQLTSIVERRGYKTKGFATPHEFFYELAKVTPNCALIDWLLPEMLGTDVVRRVRKSHGTQIGIIMITSLAMEEHIVEALDAGADDFIVKPATANVITARLDALLRRLMPPQVTPNALVAGPYEFDYALQSAKVRGTSVDLTPREFDLAWTFFESPSRLFTKQELLASIWGKRANVGTHTVSQHVYAIRKKLSFVEEHIRLISVYGSGYRLELPQLDPERGDAVPPAPGDVLHL